MATTQLCTFGVDGLLFAIEVTRVQEVMRHQPLTRVPLAPPVIAGLINLRGEIVTTIELRRLLGLAERGADMPSMNLVVRYGEGIVSVVVDTIGDVVDVDEATFERAPETLHPAIRAMVRGIYKHDNQLLLLMSTGQGAKTMEESDGRHSSHA